MNINDEIGTKLEQRTSEHILEEFEVEYYEEINNKNKVRKLTKKEKK